MARRKSENQIWAALRTMGPWRIGGALLVAILGGSLSFMLAVSGIARNKAPQLALTMVPVESAALSARADQLLFANPSNPSPQVQSLARASVEYQALNPRALRLLGYAADAQGDKQLARALVNMAARLSRREQGAQLWLIEYYAQADDTKKTLEHYDILLTTRPGTRDLLFPRLSNAIEDQSIRTALLPYLRDNKAWASEFITHAIANDKDPSNIFSLIVEAGGLPQGEAAPVQLRNLLYRLVTNARFDDARRIYRLVPGSQAGRMVDPTFTAADRDGRFGAMGWLIPDDPNAGGGFAGSKEVKKPALSIFANAATTQTVASRLLYLKPGSYRFSAMLSQLERGDGGYFQFRMRCPTDAAAGAIWSLNAIPKANTAPLDVPRSCPVQFLEIIASGGKGQLGSEATITEISIVP